MSNNKVATDAIALNVERYGGDDEHFCVCFNKEELAFKVIIEYFYEGEVFEPTSFYINDVWFSNIDAITLMFGPKFMTNLRVVAIQQINKLVTTEYARFIELNGGKV